MKQTLSDYVDEISKDILLFAKYWQDKSAKNPQLFPLRLKAGDWHDQFMTFLSLEDKD